MFPQHLELVLNKTEWKLGMAAWIFAGYSPLQKQSDGVIIRLTDSEKIQFGSIDYREAEKAKNEIKERLIVRVKASRGIPEKEPIPAKERFDRNWLISIATAPTNDISEELYIDVWWANKAVREWYLPAYIAPQALQDFSEELRKERGSLSWKTPDSDKIYDAREYSSAGFGEGTYDQSGKVDKTSKKITPLFKPGGVKPVDREVNDGYKEYLFPWFYEVIERQINIVPDKQAEIDGVEKHGSPRPTAAVARDLIIEAAKEEQPKSRFKKAKYGGDMQWIYADGWLPMNMRGETLDPDDDNDWGELISNSDGQMTMNALANRIKDWFIKTDAGEAYDEFFNLNTTKFAKKDKPS